MVFPVLNGKTAIVTGSASGMGRTTALLFAKAKANVVVVDINEEGGQKVVGEIKADGGEAIFIKTDISNSANVAEMIDKTVEKYGKLDCAVNNAAIAPDGNSLVDFDEDYWDKLLSVDLKGTALCLKYELRQMIKQGTGGSIVNIASAIINKVQPNSCNYTAAKCGVRGITRIAAIENGINQIRVNSVCPGSVETPMLFQYMEDRGIDPVQYARETVALGRFAKPEEIAQASLWLCSDAASYVTGANFDIDGGYSEL